jgi:CHAD domain-containing protein
MTELHAIVERELKLSAGEDFEFPDLGGEPIEPRLFVSTYHDTVEHRLARIGITLRHRDESGRGAWQLKLPVRTARIEVEREGAADELPTELADLLTAVLGGRELVPVARLRTRREGLRVHGAEVVRDSVAVLDGDGVSTTFSELEIELLDGDERALTRIEKALRAAGAEDGESRPKVFQALGIERGQASTVPASDLTAGRALAAALRTEYEQMLANDPGTRLGADPESLHQLRVATRRLRAFLRAGRPLVDKRWADALREELGWLGSELGPARDLDVMIEHLEAEARSLDADDAFAAGGLVEQLQREREEVRAVLLESMRSSRYAQVLEKLEAAGDPPLVGGDTELVDIWRSEHVRLRKAVDALADEPRDEELHAVRIKAKRARYAAELAGLDRYADRAKRLQDVLGQLQDAVTAEQRLRLLALDRPEQAIAAGRLVERERARQAQSRAKWHSAWKPLEKAARKAG